MGARAASPSPEELLQVAVEAVSAAGAVLRDGLGRPKQVEAKNERTSIDTWADATAQATILEVIGAHYPGHGILAEEQAGADYLGGGLATNLFAAAEFNLDLGEIEELQPEQVYSDAVIAKFAENVGG